MVEKYVVKIAHIIETKILLNIYLEKTFNLGCVGFCCGTRDLPWGIQAPEHVWALDCSTIVEVGGGVVVPRHVGS